MGELRIGTQGWNYPSWVGPFYPPGTRSEDFLRVFARAFRTVEVDSTFYAIPAERTVRGWAARVHDGFTFSLKLPQTITHERRFVDCREPLDEFVTAARLLGPKLGMILIQCGPELGPEHRPALERFLPLLPDDLSFALEFRRRGWITRGVLRMLRDHRVTPALVEGRWVPRASVLRLAGELAGGPAYVRFMGPDRAIGEFGRVQVDRGAETAEWAPTLRALAARLDEVYVYVNNHFEGHSPESARKLQRLVGQQPVDPVVLAEQRELF